MTGNPGKRALPVAEPIPTGEPVKPKFVSKRKSASTIWDKYAPELTDLGVLTSADSDMFGTLCVLMAEFQSSPARMTASRIGQMRALGSEFGMTPSSRTRIGAKPRTAPVDPAAKFFSGRAG